MDRRIFLERSVYASAALVTPQWLQPYNGGKEVLVTLLHTNDMHSRIEPFPMDGSRNQGLGGMARRSTLIKAKREEHKNLLLLDSGDIFQGTPYFNQFGGELEFKLMSEMGYDLATIGNHDFDGGLDNLTDQMKHAQFNMVNANYDFTNTSFSQFVKPYQVFEFDGVRIGVLGVGIELDGLVPAALYGRTKYYDPVERANAVAKSLREDENCEYVICLSHLGYKYRSERVSDIVLANQTRGIDLILGGHTHTFMDAADLQKNLEGEEVMIFQSGWAGILVGEVNLSFSRSCGKKKGKVQLHRVS